MRNELIFFFCFSGYTFCTNTTSRFLYIAMPVKMYDIRLIADYICRNKEIEGMYQHTTLVAVLFFFCAFSKKEQNDVKIYEVIPKKNRL